jgi:hypothetical protein
VDHEDGTLSPARLELANLLSEPRAYEAIVEAMPSCPAKVILQALGYAYGLYPPRAARTRPPERDITLVLHVEAAPAIGLTFDGSEPLLVARARLAITDQASVLDADSFASAVECAAGALLNYWMQRDAWPPDVRPAEGGSGSV